MSALCRPPLIEHLGFADRFVVWAWRQWRAGCEAYGRPPDHFWQAFEHLGDGRAGLYFDLFAQLLQGLGERMLLVAPPAATMLTIDESALIAGLAALQRSPAHPGCALAALLAHEWQNHLLHWAAGEFAARLTLLDLRLTGPSAATTQLPIASADKNQ